MTNQIELTNIGPIERLSLVAQPGTITVLRGPNGCGKSTVLNAIDRVVTGKKSSHGQLTSRDGTTGGTVDAYGVRLKISRGGANRASGECVVESVEGDLNIADFVAPPIKSPEAADARRIKALVVLTGAEAEESMFYELLPGGRDAFLEIVPESERAEPDDLLDLAGKIKRAIEREARRLEGIADNAATEMMAIQDSIAAIDLEAPHDADELEAATENAREILSHKQAEYQWFATNAAAYQDAKNALAEPAPDREQLEAEVTAANQELISVENEITEARKKLDALIHQRDLCEERIASKRERAHEAGKAAVNRERLQSLVDQFEARDRPTHEQVEKAEQELNEARTVRDAGVTIREAIKKQAEIEQRREELNSTRDRAEALRNGARGTEDVLAEVVKKSCPRLRVDEQFRLQVDHEKRGACYFSDLSEGERWRIGIEIAVAAFKAKGQPGLLQIPQTAWEGLDGDNRAVILEAIKGTDLAVITAEATHERGGDSLFAETVAQ